MELAACKHSLVNEKNSLIVSLTAKNYRQDFELGDGHVSHCIFRLDVSDVDFAVGDAVLLVHLAQSIDGDLDCRELGPKLSTAIDYAQKLLLLKRFGRNQPVNVLLGKRN